MKQHLSFLLALNLFLSCIWGASLVASDGMKAGDLTPESSSPYSASMSLEPQAIREKDEAELDVFLKKLPSKAPLLNDIKDSLNNIKDKYPGLLSKITQSLKTLSNQGDDLSSHLLFFQEYIDFFHHSVELHPDRIDGIFKIISELYTPEVNPWNELPIINKIGTVIVRFLTFFETEELVTLSPPIRKLQKRLIETGFAKDGHLELSPLRLPNTLFWVLIFLSPEDRVPYLNEISDIFNAEYSSSRDLENALGGKLIFVKYIRTKEKAFIERTLSYCDSFATDKDPFRHNEHRGQSKTLRKDLDGGKIGGGQKSSFPATGISSSLFDDVARRRIADEKKAEYFGKNIPVEIDPDLKGHLITFLTKNFKEEEVSKSDVINFSHEFPKYGPHKQQEIFLALNESPQIKKIRQANCWNLNDFYHLIRSYGKYTVEKGEKTDFLTFFEAYHHGKIWVLVKDSDLIKSLTESEPEKSMEVSKTLGELPQLKYIPFHGIHSFVEALTKHNIETMGKILDMLKNTPSEENFDHTDCIVFAEQLLRVGEETKQDLWELLQEIPQTKNWIASKGENFTSFLIGNEVEKQRIILHFLKNLPQAKKFDRYHAGFFMYFFSQLEVEDLQSIKFLENSCEEKIWNVPIMECFVEELLLTFDPAERKDILKLIGNFPEVTKKGLKNVSKFLEQLKYLDPDERKDILQDFKEFPQKSIENSKDFFENIESRYIKATERLYLRNHSTG